MNTIDLPAPPGFRVWLPLHHIEQSETKQTLEFRAIFFSLACPIGLSREYVCCSPNVPHFVLVSWQVPVVLFDVIGFRDFGGLHEWETKWAVIQVSF